MVEKFVKTIITGTPRNLWRLNGTNNLLKNLPREHLAMNRICNWIWVLYSQEIIAKKLEQVEWA